MIIPEEYLNGLFVVHPVFLLVPGFKENRTPVVITGMNFFAKYSS
jgi:hypothetical protein